MAAVRIEDDAFSDERYEDLAMFAGLADADHARGKMARIWRQCTIENTETIANHVVVRVLGVSGVDALVQARLADRVDSERVRVRGTTGRIEWLNKLRSNGRHGNKGGRPARNPQGLGEENPQGLEDETLKGGRQQTPPAPAPAPAKENTTSQVDLDLTGLLMDCIIKNNPSSQLTKLSGPDLQARRVKWANEVRLMRERDCRSPDEIRAVIAWCQNDPFWRLNILSADKLREKWDQLVVKMGNRTPHRERPVEQPKLKFRVGDSDVEVER
jgi:hypothetical protein